MSEPLDCVIVIPGAPSTDHRARSTARVVGGKARLRHHRSPGYNAWKAHVRAAGLAQRPAGWPLDRRYAVQVIGYLAAERSDADNLRGAIDALEGVLWSNDRRVRPVTYHYVLDKARPRVEVHVAIYDPKRERAVTTITIEPIGGAA